MVKYGETFYDRQNVVTIHLEIKLSTHPPQIFFYSGFSIKLSHETRDAKITAKW